MTNINVLHWTIMGIGSLFSFLLTIIMWFAIRTLKQVDKNQAELFMRLNSVERDFYVHQGICSVIHGRRRNDPVTSKINAGEEG